MATTFSNSAGVTGCTDSRELLTSTISLNSGSALIAGNGNTDSVITVLGMMTGAAVAHNFALVKAANIWGQLAIVAGLGFCVVIALNNRGKSED